MPGPLFYVSVDEKSIETTPPLRQDKTLAIDLLDPLQSRPSFPVDSATSED
jgi:hypothetical protein